MVSLKKYRPYIKGDGGLEAEEEGGRPEREYERKKKLEIEGDVNLHRVRNLKKQYKQEIEEKKKLVKQALLTSVEQEKDKYLKGGINQERIQRAAAKELSKNKLKKLKRQNREDESDGEREEGEIDNESAQ